MKIGNIRLIKRLKEYSQFNLIMVICSPLGLYFIISDYYDLVPIQFLLGTVIFYYGCILLIIDEEKYKRKLRKVNKKC